MEIGVRFIGFMQLIFRLWAFPLYFVWSLTHRAKAVPPIKDPLLLISASELARKIRRGELRSEDVVHAYITRIKEVNPYINAVVEECFSKAIQEAQETDTLISSKSKTEEQIEKETPFLGIPVTVKESCGVKGLSHCVGSVPRCGIKAERDGVAIDLIKRAGAIPILVSNTPELCLSWETTNLVTGRTTNPYNTSRTSGGSSGGEAALVGAGASVIGIGSDVAGSIRLPAMYNGVFGHKPTPGYVSIEGHYPYANDIDFDKYLVVGPITRYSEDLRPMLAVMAGEKASELNLYEKVDLQKLKVYYMTEAGNSMAMLPVEKDIKEAIHTVVDHLKKKYNVPVEKDNFKEMEDSAETSLAVFLGIKGVPNALQDNVTTNKGDNLYFELLKSIFCLSKYSFAILIFYILKITNVFIPRRNYNYYCIQKEALKERFTRILGDDGIFLYPTHPTAAYYHNQMYIKTAGVMYTMVFNVLGLPSTNVPLGLNKDGMPIGVQIVAAPHQDRLCLAVAEDLEKDLGGWIPPSANSTESQ